MEERGYYLITSGPAYDALQNSLSTDEFARVAANPEIMQELGSANSLVKKQWQDFMEHGVNVRTRPVQYDQVSDLEFSLMLLFCPTLELPKEYYARDRSWQPLPVARVLGPEGHTLAVLQSLFGGQYGIITSALSMGC
jgi:hypothetical protein